MQKQTLRISFFALFALVISFTSASAQRHIKGQLALTPYIGVVDQIKSGSSQGYGGGLELVRYTKNERYWKLSYQYDRKTYAPFGSDLLSERHMISFDYSPFSIRNYRRDFYIAPTIGANAGLETINQNNYDLPQGSILNRSTGLIGANVGVDAEFFVAPKVSLVLMVQERYLPYSTLSQFRGYGMIGVRFSFFKN